MNFTKAAGDPAVLDILRSIEDKLYERGTLVTVTRDAESEVSLGFTVITTFGEEVPALVIAVTSMLVEEPAAVDWESLSDYVNDEYLRLSSSLRGDVLAGLESSCGQFVTLNGSVVY